MQHAPRTLWNERGATMVAMGLGMGAFVALTVVAVDLGRLAWVANEVQTVADVAATAAAKPLVTKRSNWEGEGRAVASANRIDGKTLPHPKLALKLEPGNWDFAALKFTPGPAASADAVQATAKALVENFVAAAIGQPETNVEKLAVAVYAGPGVGCAPPRGCSAKDWECYCRNGSAPCLPIAVPACRFSPGGQLPALRVSPSGNDTAAWTGFQSGHDTNDIRPFLSQPPLCSAPGSGTPNPQFVGGPTIDITNGLNPSCSASKNVFGLMECIYDNKLGCRDTNGDGIPDAAGGTMFTILVIDLACTESMNGLQKVVGFATVDITGVTCDGSTKQIDLQTVARYSNNPPPPGGACFGTDCRVVLAQ